MLQSLETKTYTYSYENLYLRVLVKSRGHKNYEAALGCLKFAEDCIRQNLDKDISLFRIKFREGILECCRKEWEKALVCFQTSSQIYDKEGLSYYNIGVCQYNMRNMSEAEKAYVIAMKLMPEDMDTLKNYGIIQLINIYEQQQQILLINSQFGFQQEQNFDNTISDIIETIQQQINKRRLKAYNVLNKACQMDPLLIHKIYGYKLADENLLEALKKTLHLKQSQTLAKNRLINQTKIINSSEYSQVYFRYEIIAEIVEFQTRNSEAKQIEIIQNMESSSEEDD